MTTGSSELLPAELGWSSPTDQLHRFLVVDVFTSRPLEGNQLGVFTDGRPFSEAQMQRLAREMNFAETVFLFPAADGSDMRMRIFTPGSELPFAGHPVLGTAFVVGQALGLDAVILETKLGVVPVDLERADRKVVFGRMRQPIPTWSAYDRPDEILAAVGVKASELPIEAYQNGPTHVYIALPSEQAVAALTPDMAALQRLNVAANCFAGSDARWKTRMFYPGWGVSEDPATGSAAGPLALHLARHGRIAFGDEIQIRQGEEINRPSLLHARARGSENAIEAIEVGGAAVIVAHGFHQV